MDQNSLSLIRDVITLFQRDPSVLTDIAKTTALQTDGNALLTEFEASSSSPERKALAKLIRYFKQTQTVSTLEVFRVVTEQIAVYLELLKTREILTADSPKTITVLVNSKQTEILEAKPLLSPNEEGFYLRTITLPSDSRHIRFADDEGETIGYLPLLVLKATGATDQTIEFTPSLKCQISKHRDGWKIDVRFRLSKPQTSVSPELQELLDDISRKIQTFSGFYKAFDLSDIRSSQNPSFSLATSKAPPPPPPKQRRDFFWPTISLLLLLLILLFLLRYQLS